MTSMHSVWHILNRWCIEGQFGLTLVSSGIHTLDTRDVQVPKEEFDSYNLGDRYPREDDSEHTS